VVCRNWPSGCEFWKSHTVRTVVTGVRTPLRTVRTSHDFHCFAHISTTTVPIWWIRLQYGINWIDLDDLVNSSSCFTWKYILWRFVEYKPLLKLKNLRTGESDQLYTCSTTLGILNQYVHHSYLLHIYMSCCECTLSYLTSNWTVLSIQIVCVACVANLHSSVYSPEQVDDA